MDTKHLKPLTLRDEIHGDILLSHSARLVLDHPLFQRLRYIKQLGLAEYVFPSANHTRFQHSLGTAYLAGEYFKSFLTSWLISPPDFEGVCSGTQLFAEQTAQCIQSVHENSNSHEFWKEVCTLAGMLHDIGHGPWSHTFEILMLNQDFSDVTERIPGNIRKYFEQLHKNETLLQHEDISVIYVFRILEDLASTGQISGALKYFIPVSTLINRRILQGEYLSLMESDIQQTCDQHNILGGSAFHRLLRPLISGSFDVDRIDYIQRDGCNCGVSIGGIEWRRIVNKLLPCLASHPNNKNEPEGVVLVTSVSNLHVLDDFIFSLFQMYTQVYMHPKIVRFEESIRHILRQKISTHPTPTINFQLHSSFSDDKFRDFLKYEFGATEVEGLLLRKEKTPFHVTTHPTDSIMEQKLRSLGFTLVQTLDRPMMKDSVGVFLYGEPLSNTEPGMKSKLRLFPWNKVSPVSKEFHSMNYSPKIWLHTSTPKVNRPTKCEI